MDGTTGPGKWGVVDADRVQLPDRALFWQKAQRQTKSSRTRPNIAEVTKATQLGREKDYKRET